VAAVATMPGLRPLDLGEILDVAFRVFGRRWRSLALAALAVAVPLNLASTAIVLAFAPEQFDLDAGENPLVRLTEPGQGGALAAVTGARMLDLVASAVAVAACVWIAAGDYVGRDPGPRAALATGLRRLPETVALLLVIGIGVGLGIVLLIVPGVWLGTIWGLALPALVIERTGVFGALGRSRALVRGRFWAVLGLLVLAFLITLFSAGLVGAIAGAFAGAGGADAEAAGAVASLVSGVASMVFAVPLASTMLFVMYVDQRVRGEGLTVHALARELGVPDVPPEPLPGSPGPEPLPGSPGPDLPGGWQPPRAGR
jgi:hypothetical protein